MCLPSPCSSAILCFFKLLFIVAAVVVAGYSSKLLYSAFTNEPVPAVRRACGSSEFWEYYTPRSSTEEEEEERSTGEEEEGGGETSLGWELEYLSEIESLFSSLEHWESVVNDLDSLTLPSSLDLTYLDSLLLQKWVSLWCREELYNDNGDVDLWHELGVPEFWEYNWQTFLAGLMWVVGALVVLCVISCLCDGVRRAFSLSSVYALIRVCCLERDEERARRWAQKRRRGLVDDDDEAGLFDD